MRAAKEYGVLDLAGSRINMRELCFLEHNKSTLIKILLKTKNVNIHENVENKKSF